MSVIQSRYQTRVSSFVFSGATVEQILTANPRRFFVQIRMGTGVMLSYPPSPGPSLNVAFGGFSPSLDYTWKFKDCPSVVTGEFYAGGTALGTLLITECIYLE